MKTNLKSIISSHPKDEKNVLSLSNRATIMTLVERKEHSFLYKTSNSTLLMFYISDPLSFSMVYDMPHTYLKINLLTNMKHIIKF